MTLFFFVLFCASPLLGVLNHTVYFKIFVKKTVFNLFFILQPFFNDDDLDVENRRNVECTRLRVLSSIVHFHHTRIPAHPTP